MPTDGDPSAPERVLKPTTAESCPLEHGGAEVARLLVRLWREQKSGTLHLSGEGSSLRIRLVRGRIEAAGPQPPEVDFGEFLVRTGRLKRTDLELASRVMRETGQGSAQTLIEMGFASGRDMRGLVAEHARSVIAPVLAWPRGAYRFEVASDVKEAGFGAALLPVEIILQVVREDRDPAVLWRGLGAPGLGLVWPDVPAPEGVAAMLNPSESLVLDLVRTRLDKACWPSEIVELSPLPEDETQRCLYALVAVGMFDVRGAAEGTPSSAVGPPSTPESLGRTAPPGAGHVDPALSAQPPAPRRLGRHAVVEEIGRGAMGAVFLAKDPTIDRVVAIKLIQAAAGMGESDLEKYATRFYQEARAAGKLHHPGIVTVFDVAHTEDGTPYIVMEYVRGTTLSELMKTGPLGFAEMLQITGEILDALGYAHEHGVIHRDVKPANVLVTLEGKVKIMDFGVAHLVGSELTQAEEVIGTPSYMAPEQLSKEAVDRRADIFAFGVLLYEMTTGRLPFTGDSIFAIAQAVVAEEPAPVHEVNPDVPAALSAVVARCVRKAPEQRFQTAAEVKQALLSAFAASDVAGAPPEVLLVESEGVDAGATPPELGPTPGAAPPPGRGLAAVRWRPSPRLIRRSAAAAAALGAGGLLLLALVLALRREAPSTLDGDRVQTASGTSEGFSGEEEQDGIIEPAASPTSLGPAKDATPSPDGSDDAPGSPAAPKSTSPRSDDAPRSAVAPKSATPSREAPGGDSRPVAPAPAPPPRAAADTGGRSESPSARAPADQELLVRALAQREEGDLEASRASLEALVRRGPDFPGAASLLAQIEDELWLQTVLPMVFQARHKHRLGSCEGTLTLDEEGVAFDSEKHGNWRWGFGEIREMERKEVAEIELRTGEKDVLRLGKAKRYVFELVDRGLSEEDWERYQRFLP
jgi:serine/threonine protein kinase